VLVVYTEKYGRKFDDLAPGRRVGRHVPGGILWQVLVLVAFSLL